MSKKTEERPVDRPVQVVSSEKKRTPGEHLAASRESIPRRQRDNALAIYKAAAVLHGWAEHAHHAGAPIALTADAYAAALAAVDTFKPHEAALSPYKGKGL